MNNTITSQKDLRNYFWYLMFPQYKPKKGFTWNDYCVDVRVAWVYFIDSMHKDGRISDELACKATL